MLELRPGSNDQNTGGEVTHWQQWFKRYASSYAPPIDGYYGSHDEAAVRILQGKLGIVVDGYFGDRTAAKVGYKPKGTSTVPYIEVRRPIWFYSAPGSGADWWFGPSFETGEYAKNVLKLNHQPIGFQKGGYLGFLGGDPKFSYNEVIEDLFQSLRSLLRLNPDVTKAMQARAINRAARVDVELHFSGYSQSAHGILEAVNRLFGDGGEFELIRDRVNLVICFGNPATQKTGIADRVYPQWLNEKTRDLNMPKDFYAFAPDEIRRAFFQIIVQAELELPFGVHVIRIALPIIMQWASTFLPFLTPLLGGFGPAAQLGMGMITGLQGLGNNPLVGGLMGQAGLSTDTETDKRIIALLTPMGLLGNIPALIQLMAALPGLQAHGDFAPLVPRACRLLDDFRK